MNLRVMDSLKNLFCKNTKLSKKTVVAAEVEAMVLDDGSFRKRNYDCITISSELETLTVDFVNNDTEKFKRDVEFAEEYLFGSRNSSAQKIIK